MVTESLYYVQLKWFHIEVNVALEAPFRCIFGVENGILTARIFPLRYITQTQK
jgi:hypothetical protein